MCNILASGMCVTRSGARTPYFDVGFEVLTAVITKTVLSVQWCCSRRGLNMKNNRHRNWNILLCVSLVYAELGILKL